MSKVITFYSYKGGVGRSQALANVSVLLAKWGYRVLIIDWDLEAPGLENFFTQYIDLPKIKKKDGLIDILTPNTDKTVLWRNCLVPIEIKNEIKEGKLDLITAGNRDQNYYERVRSFEIKHFYEVRDGGNIIESLRNEWKSEYDFILIDSRTGITDIGGICTIQLPDIMVLLFTATHQSLDGVIDVAEKALIQQQEAALDRLNLLFLPIPTRFDKNTEYDISEEWLRRFEKRFEFAYAPWLPKSQDRYKFISNTKVPYVAFFSYGEKLAVTGTGVVDPAGMGYAYESITGLLATNLNDADLLIGQRDKLMHRARREPEPPEGSSYAAAIVNLPKNYWKRAAILSGVLLIFIAGFFTIQANIEASNQEKLDSLIAQQKRDSVAYVEDSLYRIETHVSGLQKDIVQALYQSDTLKAIQIAQELLEYNPEDEGLKKQLVELSQYLAKVDAVVNRLNAFYEVITTGKGSIVKFLGPANKDLFDPGVWSVYSGGYVKVVPDSLFSMIPVANGYHVLFLEKAILGGDVSETYSEVNSFVTVDLDDKLQITNFSRTIQSQSESFLLTDVDVFFYEGNKATTEPIADSIVNVLSKYPCYRVKKEKLSEKTNQMSQYQIDQPEIRYDSNEKEVAEMLQTNIAGILGKDGMSFRLTRKTYTSYRYLSVFVY